MKEKQEIAGAWFRELRDLICGEFERIEQEFGTSSSPHIATSSFTRTPWQRPEGPPSPEGSGATSGGGEMSILRGQVFEKVGVNISTVHGEFSEAMRKEIPGASENPQFWASGISLVAHMRSPLVPAVHMNTRMIALSNHPMSDVRCQMSKHRPSTSDIRHPASHLWFGGGADLTPMYPVEADTRDFHAAFKQACDAFDPGYYPKYKAWCDEYFFLKHRNEPRGVGGIFYDYLNSGDWQRDFAFTQEVGKTFLAIYPQLVRRHMFEEWTPQQREHQLVKRGRYVEFNLLYDRGTRFGLMTGGNTEAILMSLPPEVTWP